MAQNYTRQSSFADGDTITAALFNNEFNQVVNAFAYSASSDSSTGHKHDGTSGQGGNIPQIGDIDFLNKIVVDNTNNRWGFYVQVSSGTVEQLRIQDGAIVPVTNNDIDLGTSSLEFKDLFIDGTAHIDTLDVDVNATVAGTLGVTGATTLSSNLSVGGNLTVTGNATIAGNLTFGDAATDTVAFSADVASNLLPSADNTYDLGASGSEWKDLYIDGTANIDSLIADTADINGGTVDSAIIGGTTPAAITGTVITAKDSNGAINLHRTNTAGVAITQLISDNVGKWQVGMQGSTDDYSVYDVDASTNRLTINATTGAATFNSSVTATGTSVFASLDISGDIDVDGTANLDIVDIDGAVNIAAATTIATDNKIQFRDTAIYVNSSADGQLDIVADTEIQIAATTVDLNGNLDVSGTTVSAGKITADAGIDIDNINIDGTTIALSSGDLTLDVAGDIIFDADGDDFIFAAAGTNIGKITNSSSDFLIRSLVQDKDIIFKGDDAGSVITALTLDMSDAGAATFNAGATFGGASEIRSTLNATLNITSTAFTVNSDDVYGSLNFVTEDGSVDSDRKNAATIQAINAGGSGSYCDLDFYTSAGTGATDTKSLKIASNGDISFYDDSGNATLFWDASAESLGIGTTSPIAALDVAGTDAVGSLTSLSDTATRAAAIIRGSTHANGYGLYMGYANSSTDAQYIQSTLKTGSQAYPLLLNPYGGNVGIGTTTLRTGYALDVQGVNDNGVNIQSGNAASDIALSVGSTSTADKFVILAGGSVGIGTDSPNEALHVYNATTNVLANFESGDATAFISFKDNSTTNTDTVFLGADGNNMAFYAGSASLERFRIASDGSLSTTTLGTSNVRFGVNAGNSIASGGNYNTVVGDEAGTAITTGDKNVAVGYSALTANTTAINNTAVGTFALNANTTGDLNVAIGVEALGSNVAGDRSVAIGNNALAAQNPSSNVDMYNVAVGLNAGLSVTTGVENTLIGGLAGDAITIGNYNIAIGHSALGSEDSRGRAVAVGYQALATQNADADSYNTAVGFEAGKLVTTGVQNTLIGGLAGDAITTGNYNVGVGYLSLSANTTGASNTAIGNYALNVNTTANDNTAVGNAALKDNTTGANNVAVGRLTLTANTTASYNTAVGTKSLEANTTGASLVAVGYAALDKNTTGDSNVAVGESALGANTTASNNTAVGTSSLVANTTGTENSAIGESALATNTTGRENAASGRKALFANTTGSYNAASGATALATNTTGANNTAHGYRALYLNTTASNNSAVGYKALYANTTGANNVAVGVSALDANTTGGQSIAVGASALTTNTTGDYNVGIGHQAAFYNTTGTEIIAVGHNALLANTTGAYNVAVGGFALDANTTASNNTAVGYASLGANTTGTENTAVGTSALTSNVSGNYNVAIGRAALNANTASYNTGVGHNALSSNSSGVSNTAVGQGSLGANTTGTNNVAVGSGVLDANTDGDYNVAVGNAVLGSDTRGNFSTGIGHGALNSQNTTNDTDMYNTAVGYLAGTLVTTGVNNTFVGGLAGDAITTGDYNVIVGSQSDSTAVDSEKAQGFGFNLACAAGYTTIGSGSDDIRAAHGNVTWATVSDERYKKDIVDSEAGLSLINALRPRTFKYKTLGELPETFNAFEADSTEVFKNSDTNHGFIAQEVKAAIDADDSIKDGFRLWDDRDDGSQEVAEAALIPVLVKAIQELTARIETLEG